MKEVHCVVRCIVLCVRTHRRNPNHPNRPPMQPPPIPSNPQMHTFSPILHNSHITLLDTTQFTHYTPGYTRATRCHYACHTMHATFLRMPLFSTACHSPHNTLLHSPPPLCMLCKPIKESGRGGVPSVSYQVPEGECIPEADAAGEAENDRGREHSVLEETPEGPGRVRGCTEACVGSVSSTENEY